MVTQELLNLGLSAREADVYVATLQLGYATVQKIAAKAEINRTTAYTHIKNLISRGLVSVADHNGKQLFVAEKPERLHSFYNQQAEELKRRQESLSRIMPELESLYHLDADRPSVRFYGKGSVAKLRGEILDSRADELFCIYNHEQFKDHLDKSHIERLLDQTLSYKKLYVAVHKVLDRRLLPLKDDRRFNVRFLPLSKFNFPCELVMGDKQVFIARQNDSFIIKDSLFSQTLKIFFHALWELAEEF